MTKNLVFVISFLAKLKTTKPVLRLTTLLLLIGASVLLSSAIFAEDQQKTVTGRITDNTGQALPGVNILEKGTINGAISDVDGKFTLNVASVNSVLVFSFVGYTPQEVTVGSQSTINVSLVENAVGLDEIVVIGYGTQQKRAISGSVTNVTEKSFNVGITRNAADLLQGKVAGLAITTASGDVTSEQSIRLRGTSSLTGSSEPFVVIDGVPGMSMNAVAPQDIESISILKDAASTAIYGSRSASGVILITTKKGKKNMSTVDYNGYVGIDNVTNKPDVLTAEEWRNYCTENSLSITGMDLGANTDWFGEIMRTGITQNHDLSFSGGGSNNNYRASISYLDQQGVVRDNFSKRLNSRLSFNQTALKDRLNISVIGAMNQRDYQPADTRNFVLAYNMLPVYPVKYDDGTWYDNQEYDQGNPVRNIQYNSNLYEVNSFYTNIKADLKILKNLTASVNAFKERGTTDRSLYYDSNTERGRNAQGYGQRTWSSYNKKLLETTLNYAGKIGENHTYGLLAGYSWEDNFSKGANAQNRLFVTNLFGYNNLGAGENLQTGDATSWASMDRLISFFGRLNYSFADRYILSASLRRDGSSKFGENHRWGTFPSVSAAWRIIDEPFLQSIKGVMDELKIRVGYGVSGNQAGLNPYQSMQLYGSSGTYWDSGSWHTAYAVSQNANPDLRWEQTAMFNVGVDYSAFDGRINGTIEYYDKRTSDLLYTYTVPVPPYLYSSMVANVGGMKNTGIEFLVNADIVRKTNFRWTVSVNAAHNENIITSLSNAEFTTSAIKTGSAWVRGGSDNTTHIVEEGKSVGTFYGWRCLGLDDSGMYIWDDMVNGVAGLQDEDRTYIGNAQPKLTYGFSNTLTYKDFEFSFFIRGVYGNDVLNFSKMSYATTQWLPGANVLYDALTIGLKDNPKYNSFYIEKASFARMENMNLAYTMRPDFLGINTLRFYVTSHNLFTLTKYSGVDPEVSMSGLDPGVEGREYYPKSRTFLFGINVNF
jgi:TonB-dependent starch-binding outer membrane protein SusC